MTCIPFCFAINKDIDKSNIIEYTKTNVLKQVI